MHCIGPIANQFQMLLQVVENINVHPIYSVAYRLYQFEPSSPSAKVLQCHLISVALKQQSKLTKTFFLS